MTDPQQPDPWASPSAPPTSPPYDQSASDPFTVPVQPAYGPAPVWTDPTGMQPPTAAPVPPSPGPAPFVSPNASPAPPYAIGASPVPQGQGPGPGYGPGYEQATYPVTYAPPYQAQGYGGYGGYGSQPYYPYAAPAAKTNGLAIASMVVSIIGAVLIPCYGVGLVPGAIGAILGHVARRQIANRKESGGGMALAGIIVGWIAFALALAVLAVIVVGIVYAVNNANTTTYTY